MDILDDEKTKLYAIIQLQEQEIKRLTEKLSHLEQLLVHSPIQEIGK